MTMATAGNALRLTLAERRGAHKSEFLESGDVAKWVARKRAVVNIWNWSAQPVMKGSFRADCLSRLANSARSIAAGCTSRRRSLIAFL